MGSNISKKRKEMGEEKWAEYQRIRKRDNVRKYTASLKVVISRRRKKALLVQYKGGKCEICGFDKPVYDCYDFHHIDPNKKEFGISGKNSKNYSIELLKIEVDKCMLLCANCHREIHGNETLDRIKEKLGNNSNISIDNI